MKNSVEVINLKKAYGLKEAVKNISFKIKNNEINFNIHYSKMCFISSSI